MLDTSHNFYDQICSPNASVLIKTHTLTHRTIEWANKKN